jgi:hypothetical protein
MIVLLVACASGPDLGSTPPSRHTGDTTDTAHTGGSTSLVTDLTMSAHPDVATILSVGWRQAEAGESWLSWQLDGVEYRSPTRVRPAGPASEVVLGLPAEAEVSVSVHLVVDGVEAPVSSVSATTGPLPFDLPSPSLTLTTDAAEPSPWLLTSVNAGDRNFFGPCYVVIVDRAGRIVWYRLTTESRLTLFPRVARDGTHIAWDATTYYVPATAGLHRATLSLSHVSELQIPEMGFTWDELPDGSLLYDEAESDYAYHLTRRWPDGRTSRLWSCAPWMAGYSEEFWACAANTVLWDAATDHVLWSMFETSTVVALDLDSGAMVWELGDYPGGLVFDPPEASLELQHYPNPTPDGTILLTTHSSTASEQHIREFRIADGVATQVWHYSEPGYYGSYAGEAQRLSNGNTLINYGTDGVLREVTPEGVAAWELNWDDHLLGHVTPLDDLYTLDVGW